MNFWQKLPKPFFCLAPMSDVTDIAFRQIVAKYSKWGGRDVSDEEAKSHFAQEGYAGQAVMFTEFVSADGLCSAGKKKLLHILKFSESERPIAAQIFGAAPEKIFEAVKLVKKLGFDGVDINMGCPDRAVVKSGAGAALMKTPKLAREIIRAAKSASGDLPVSVKTRIGFNKDELDEWLPELLAEEPAAITIHARTKKQMSDAPADWNAIARAVKIRDSLKSKTLIIGNGDVRDLEDARQKIKDSGADGAMLGRAVFGNPFLFSQKCPELVEGLPATKTKLEILIEHAKLFQKLLGKSKNFDVMKKHFKAYVSGFDGAKELRIKLMQTENAGQVEKIVSEYLKAV